MGFVVQPLALVDVAVGVLELALPVRLVKSPLALVARTVRPNLMSEAVSHIVQPLSSVDSSVLQLDSAHLNYGVVVRLLSTEHLLESILRFIKVFIFIFEILELFELSTLTSVLSRLMILLSVFKTLKLA